ncbi:MAG TPA: hypothetical protein VFW44_09650 [Bryobacteraceae bacterium]|nr:hypothetical protein [Bryobacteraceae bacterium]
MRYIALIVLMPALFAAENKKLPEPYQTIADLASTAPPEFTADALLRIVESGRLPDKSQRAQLIEQAFQLGVSAKFPLRMTGVQGTTTDTASGSLSQAYALKLDALSLESRAVRDMLPLDPAKARDLFRQIALPALTALDCDAALRYEPSDYYQALSAVVNGAFTAKEKAKEEHLNLLLDALGQVSSSSQLAPLEAAIKSASLTTAQRETLLARFGALSAQYARNDPDCKTAPKIERYWQSAAAKRLLDGGTGLRVADRAKADWQLQLPDYLNLIADWSQDPSESDAVFYHEKCLVYTSLLDLVRSGPQADGILADFVAFVGNSGLYQRSPVEWFIDAYTVLDRSQGDPDRHAKVLAAFARSGNPVLVLTVALENAFHRT